MIFFHQKMRNWYLGNYKKEGEKSLPILTGGAKNEILGPSRPLSLMHLSVKSIEIIRQSHLIIQICPGTQHRCHTLCHR